MGWATGSRIMTRVIESLMDNFPYSMSCTSDARKRFYKDMIKEFEGEDCDTLDECRGKDHIFDEAFDEVRDER